MKILILKPSSLGDVIQALPVLRLLRRAHPKAEIYWWIDSRLAPLLAGKSEMDLYRYFFSSTTGIFLTMRWAWGLLAPIGLGYFIWDTVRLSSTRSATGILYVAVVFVLIGETMAQYLLYFHGIPG